ncbi:MAG TPA: NADH-quinone oxidoreductase subunit M, partial [Microthrixaceae bacterium]|nr:NADH-quinone oxidoreductase subunit M [Microthrixaceae bacterium]
MDKYNWALPVVTFLPLAGALVMMLLPKEEEQLHKAIALLTSLATLAVGVFVFLQFDYGNGHFQFLVDRSWIEVINSRFIMGIDGLSLPLFGLTLAVVPLVIIYSWNHIPDPGNPKAFLALMLILETGMIGSFVAEDLILFFVFFEIVLLPMYFMIGVWGGPERKYASIKFFVYTLFGSALMILSFLALYQHAHTFDMRQLRELSATIAHGTQLLIFGGMFVGFGIKVPMFPFHTWLPDAHTQAPTQGSVILAAVLLKLGTY